MQQHDLDVDRARLGQVCEAENTRPLASQSMGQHCILLLADTYHISDSGKVSYESAFCDTLSKLTCRVLLQLLAQLASFALANQHGPARADGMDISAVAVQGFQEVHRPRACFRQLSTRLYYQNPEQYVCYLSDTIPCQLLTFHPN